MTSSEMITFEQFLMPIRNTFSKIGLSTILQEKNDRNWRRIDTILIGLTICNSVYSDVTLFIALMDDTIGLDDKIELCACALTNLLGISKIMSLYMKRDQLTTILQTLEEEWPKFDEQIEKDAYNLFINPIVKISCMYENVVIFAPLIFVLLPVLDKIKDGAWRLPFYVYYPFQWKNSFLLYGLCYLQQMHVGFVTGYSMTSNDCLLLLCLSCISLHFNILTSKLNKLNTHDLKSVEWELHALYKRHVQLIRLVASVQDLFSNSLAAVFSINSFLICVLMFVFTIAPVISLPKYALFLTAVLLQTLLLCWFGDQLTEQASKVGSGAYLCKWRTLPSWCRKDLAFVIMRANKPLRLQGGPFACATLGTFTSILSSSWTYFNLMRMLFGSKAGHGLAKF